MLRFKLYQLDHFFSLSCSPFIEHEIRGKHTLSNIKAELGSEKKKKEKEKKVRRLLSVSSIEKLFESELLAKLYNFQYKIGWTLSKSLKRAFKLGFNLHL